MVRPFRLLGYWVPPPFVDELLRLRLAGTASGPKNATTNQANNFTLLSRLFSRRASRSPSVQIQSTCCAAWAGHRPSLRQLVGTRFRDCLNRAREHAAFEHCDWVPLAKRLRCRHRLESGSLGTQRDSMDIPCIVSCSSYPGVPQAAPRSMLTCRRRKHKASMAFLQFHEGRRNSGTNSPEQEYLQALFCSQGNNCISRLITTQSGQLVV